ncbi:MAG TPA: hypothetical protein VF150_09335 [Thermoanaerobaculia bacterium]
MFVLTLSCAPAAVAEILVGHLGGGSPRISTFADGANGDVLPLRQFSTLGSDLAIDATRRELFVAGNEIAVYDLDSPGLPLRRISGPETGLSGPSGIALDAERGELFVANFDGDSVSVYRADGETDTDGVEPPLRTLSGPLTDIRLPIGIAVDSVNNELFVTSHDQFFPSNPRILVFRLTDSGNVAPLRTLGGSATLLAGPRHLALDLEHDELIVAQADGDAVNVYSRTAAGNAAPKRRISGPSTGLDFPFGVALGPGGAYLITSNSNDSVKVFARTASGDVAPLRSIAGPNTGLDSPAGIAFLATAAPGAGVCAEHLLVPFYLVDRNHAGGTTTLFAVRNLSEHTVTADVEYFTVDGTSQGSESVDLDPQQARTVNLRDVPGLAKDPDGFARGFVRILGASDPDGGPVLEGDFFQVDVDGNFATGDRLARQTALCREASLRFLDFGAGTRLTIYVADPRGDQPNVDPPSFTVQVYDEAGAPVGAAQPVWTADHALEMAAADFTASPFGALQFDFTDSLGGTVYAEYSAFGRFSVGLSSQCEDQGRCAGTDCCPPGAPKAIAAGIHYPRSQFPDCAAAISDALTTLDSFDYRDACWQAHGGDLPDSVLGAAVVDCRVDPPLSEGNVVVAVEACCPLP